MLRIAVRGMLLATIALNIASPLLAQPKPPNIEEQLRALSLELQKFTIKLRATTDQEVIDQSDVELKRFSKVSVAASVSQAGAAASLQGAVEGNKAFSNPQIVFSNQSASASLDFSGHVNLSALPNVEVKARLNSRLAPKVALASTDGRAEFIVAFSVSRLEIELQSVTAGGRPLSGVVVELAQAIANAAIKPAQEALNHLEIRVPTVASTKVDIKVPNMPGLTTSVRPSELTAKIEATALAYLMDNGRFWIAAQISTPARLAEPAKRVSIDQLRGDFAALVSATDAKWLQQGDFSVYIDGAVIEQVASKLLGGEQVCLHTEASALKVPIHAKIPLPPEDTIDCDQKKECRPDRDCRSNRDCDAVADCTPKRNCDAVKDCGGYKWYQGWDKARCETEKSLAKLDCERIKSTEKGLCELNKGTRKADCERLKSQEKGLCELEKTGSKSMCESLKGMGKPACEVLKAGYAGIRSGGSDFANVDSEDMTLNGSADVCLGSISLTTKGETPLSVPITEFAAKLSGSAQAKIAGLIKFTPLGIAGHALCFAEFQKRVDETARVPTQSADIRVTASFADDPNRVFLKISVPSTIKVSFPVSNIAFKLATDPSFALTCPVGDILAKVRAVTPEKWWPAALRGDIEKEFPPVSFEYDVVKAVTEAGKVKLVGALQHTSRGVGATFSIKK
jgi:hypothetical protein